MPEKQTETITVTTTMTVQAAKALLDVAEAHVDNDSTNRQEAVHDAIQAVRDALAASGVEVDWLRP
jgi:hypothetical protein